MGFPAYVAGLKLPISETRMRAYQPPGSTDLDMVVNYLWNLELSEALYPSLQAVEISLRNGIHAAVSSRYGTEFWFDVPNVLLRGQARMIQKAKDKLSDEGKPHEAGRIVAALSFGFWTSLFNDPYERAPRRSPGQLAWHDRTNHPSLLLAVFPSITRRYRARRQVAQRIENIRSLRNRVYHYEPIWNRSYLDREHTFILHTIEWISPDMLKTVRISDRFDEIYHHGKAEIERKIKGAFGLA